MLLNHFVMSVVIFVCRYGLLVGSWVGGCWSRISFQRCGRYIEVVAESDVHTWCVHLTAGVGALVNRPTQPLLYDM